MVGLLPVAKNYKVYRTSFSSGKHIADADRAAHGGLATDAAFRGDEQPLRQEYLHSSTATCRERSERGIKNAWLPRDKVHAEESSPVMETADACDYIRNEALCWVGKIIGDVSLDEVILIVR